MWRQARGGRPLDIVFLVEQLERLIANGRRLPLTKDSIIDRDAALAIIDEMRLAVPEEVRAAKRINSESTGIIHKAEEQAEEIVARAQEQAAMLIDERGLTLAAQEESRRIIARAEQDAEDVRHGADEYAAGVLEGLQASVSSTLRSIDRGLAMLDERRAAYAANPDGADGYAPEAAYDESYDHEDDPDASAPRR